LLHRINALCIAADYYSVNFYFQLDFKGFKKIDSGSKIGGGRAWEEGGEEESNILISNTDVTMNNTD